MGGISHPLDCKVGMCNRIVVITARRTNVYHQKLSWFLWSYSRSVRKCRLNFRLYVTRNALRSSNRYQARILFDAVTHGGTSYLLEILRLLPQAGKAAA